ncbi:MAG: fumarylacetoacetate hydrolase family protein [Candidatus Korobacteraceae bacterium]|jgi:2-keto-4-pentenoate hydratase/2-oxohepta-3-ene-1,7-dioic acid hydratase in catechol pathway
MKLLRYGPAGQERPGLLDSQGKIRDLSVLIGELSSERLSPAGLRALAALNVEKLPLVEGSPRLGIPYRGMGKFLAIGLNYSDHAKETNQAIPSEPVVFIKANSCLNGPYDDIVLPKDSKKADWKVELGVVIGSKAQCVSEQEALNYVAGYCLVNDVSERAFQIERGGTIDKGKGCDTFGPVGPWLVTADEVGDPQALDMWLDVNGKRMQTGNTRTMIFGVARLVSYISHFMSLNPGDLITTGTPPGVGFARKPPIFLQPGDLIHAGINKLGEQRQKVVSWPG